MKFIEIQGEIIGSETWSQTRVSGSSTGIAYKGIGGSSGRTTSTVSNVSQIWVKTSDGREIAVRTNPDKFAVRDGHKVSMLLSVKNSGPGWMVAGVNHSTGDTRRESLAGLYFPVTLFTLLFCWIPLVAVAMNVVLGIIVAGLFVWWIGYMYRTIYQVGRKGSEFISKTRARPVAEHGEPGPDDAAAGLAA